MREAALQAKAAGAGADAADHVTEDPERDRPLLVGEGDTAGVAIGAVTRALPLLGPGGRRGSVRVRFRVELRAGDEEVLRV